MRPTYEKPQDVANEETAVGKFCTVVNCEAVKLPMKSRADSLLFRDGKAKFIVEVKTRRNVRLKYPTYMISQDKYAALCEWEHKGFTPLLLVQWADALGVVNVPVEHTVSTGGRYDRNDPKDVESVVLIKVEAFHVVE